MAAGLTAIMGDPSAGIAALEQVRLIMEARRVVRQRRQNIVIEVSHQSHRTDPGPHYRTLRAPAAKRRTKGETA